MGKLQILTDFKEKIDKELEIYFDEAIEETKKKDVLMAGAVRYIKKMVLAGGKRMRPAFMYFGYIAAGGKDRKKILKASMSVELIHAYLLIHDDIMDRDKMRHGIDSIHYHYDKFAQKAFLDADTKHFGNSMAIIIGDMANAFGNQIMFDSKFKAGNILKALHELQGIISLTVIGQAQDFYIEYSRKATEKSVMQMYENKTAKYSIEGPLVLGATLAGANNALKESFGHYAVPLGTAFQIQDDILGIFGSEKKMGKKVGADIEEGKQTLLVIKARELGSAKQKDAIKKILGKKNLTIEEIAQFQEIIRETGALDYAKNLAQKLVLGAKKELEKMKINPEAKNFLAEIADYMIEREL